METVKIQSDTTAKISKNAALSYIPNKSEQTERNRTKSECFRTGFYFGLMLCKMTQDFMTYFKRSANKKGENPHYIGNFSSRQFVGIDAQIWYG